MSNIFISYAAPDRVFALQLSGSLTRLGHRVWIDTQAIQAGASIPQSVATAVDQADYLVVVLSKQSASSAWCAAEWQAKYWDEVVRRQNYVLPVLLEDCSVPLFLRPKLHIDFRSDYALGLAQLALSLCQPAKIAIPASIEPWEVDAAPVERPSGAASLLASESAVWYTDPTMTPLARLVEVNVALELPYFGKIAGVWKPDEEEQNAAWELYIELMTRISVAELSPNEGLLRESLSSLYGIFTTTRQILRIHGPTVARPKKGSDLSFGYLAINVLNFVLRPVLAKWHPLLLDYEHRREESTSALQHEAAWEHAAELRQALSQTRVILLEYTKLLAQISRVPTAIPE